MKSTPTLALLLGCFAIAAAPGAEAYERNGPRGIHADHGFHDEPGPRQLAIRLERAADAFLREARHQAGHPNGREARALSAARQLERATDALAREARERRLDRGFARDLKRVAKRFDAVRDRVHALPRSHVLGEDLRRMDRLIQALEARVHPQRRFAATGHAERHWHGDVACSEDHTRRPHGHDRRGDRYARR